MLVLICLVTNSGDQVKSKDLWRKIKRMTPSRMVCVQERTRTRRERRNPGKIVVMMTHHFMMSLDPSGDQVVVTNPGYMGNNYSILNI